MLHSYCDVGELPDHGWALNEDETAWVYTKKDEPAPEPEPENDEEEEAPDPNRCQRIIAVLLEM